MAGLGNNLYPPIFTQSYMPAFVKEQGCRVYFSISNFNAEGQIKTNAVQVSVRSQKTNKTVLRKDLYPSEIKLATLMKDETRNSKDQYYIIITNNDIQNGFNYGEYYKVQIRFTSSSVAQAIPANNALNTWLNNNLGAFSEWSSVVLIKAISNPILNLNNFSEDVESTTLNLNNLNIIGSISFADKNDSELLKSYYIHIYDMDDNLLEDSGQLYSDNNKIEYICKYKLLTGTTYKLGIQILTNNLYSWENEKIFEFEVNDVPYTTFTSTIVAQPDNSIGGIKIHLHSDIFLSMSANIVIKRSSNKSNFTIWDEVCITFLEANKVLNFSWTDYTVESGVWYKYSACLVNKQGFYSTENITKNAVMVNLDDIFLVSEDGQLKIKFDPVIDSYSYVKMENLNQTLGSEFPFITRNGHVNYRTFSLSGTISYFMDIKENLLHASKEDLYGENLSLYNNYNSDNNITLFNDDIIQRNFREKVMNFLYKNNVKLYKSTTEGNILVKLMNISFTPNATLNRHIYSFSCTAYEIDKFSYENCLKYNIQSKGQLTTQTAILTSIIGQLYAPSKDVYWNKDNLTYDNRVFAEKQYFGTGDLLTTIKQQYSKFENENIQISESSYLSYLKIELSSPPYRIGINNNIPYRITNTTINAVCLGHIIYINGVPIIIGENGIYELTEEDTKITSINFIDANEQGSISYFINLIEEEKESSLPKDYSSFYKIGQFWGSFNSMESIYSKIYMKYNTSYSTDESVIYSQTLEKILGMRIYTNEGTVFYLKDKKDNNLNRYVIGSTGLLEFYDEETDIQGLYFVGTHLLPATNLMHPGDAEFVETNLVFNSFDEIRNPIKNNVYTIVNFDNEPDTTQVNAAELGITTQELAQLNTLVAAATDSNILIKDKILNWVNNSTYITNLSNQEANKFVDLLYQSLLKQYINSGKKYIYYEGGWHLFTDQHDVVLDSLHAIIDYYCYIIRKRY